MIILGATVDIVFVISGIVILILLFILWKYRVSLMKLNALYMEIKKASPWLYDVLFITDLKSCTILENVSILRDKIIGRVNGKQIVFNVPQLKYPIQSYILDLRIIGNENNEKLGFLLGVIRENTVYPVVKRRHINYLLLVPEFITMLSRYLSYDIRGATQEAKEILKTAGQMKRMLAQDREQLALYLGGYGAVDRRILKAFATGYMMVSEGMMSLEKFENMVLEEGYNAIRQYALELISRAEEEKKGEK